MGKLFKAPGYVLYFVGGIWGLLISLAIVREVFGSLGFIIGFVFLPFTIGLAPWYAAFADGNWFPLILIYGSGIGGTLLIVIGSAIEKGRD